MKYNLIEIKQTPKFCSNRFDVKFDNSDLVDRKSCSNYIPHGLGFFHYPRRWEVSKAFNLLKDRMLNDVNNEISKLGEYKKDLEQVCIPEWVLESDKKQKCKT